METLLGQEERIKLKDARRLNLDKVEKEIESACSSAYITADDDGTEEPRISFNLIYNRPRCSGTNHAGLFRVAILENLKIPT